MSVSASASEPTQKGRPSSWERGRLGRPAGKMRRCAWTCQRACPRAASRALPGKGGAGPWTRAQVAALAAILAAGLALRAALVPASPFLGDMAYFTAWARALLTTPLGDFYALGAPNCDYLPGYLYLLWVTAHLATAVAGPIDDLRAFAFWVKLAPIAADLAMGVVVFQMARRFARPRRALLAAGLVVLNPGIAMVSAAWGQVDSIAALLSLLALSALMAASPVGAAFWAAAAFAVKPQYPLFLIVAGVAYLGMEIRRVRLSTPAPPNAVWLKWTLRRVLLPVVLLVAAVQLLLSPFSVSLLPGLSAGARWSLLDRLSLAAAYEPRATVNAFNLWGTPLAGPAALDTSPAWFSLSYQTWGILLLTLVLAAASVLAWRRATEPATILWACYVASFGTFELATRMHERYLLMAVPLVALVVAARPRASWFYWATSALYLVNILYAYFVVPRALGLTPEQINRVFEVVSSLSVLLFLACLASLGVSRLSRKAHAG